MKASKQTQHDFRSALDAMLENSAYTKEQWVARYAKEGLSAKRARWDAVWAISRDTRQPLFDAAYEQEDMTDEHIDTILRHYFK